MCRPCPGPVLAATETQPIFRHFYAVCGHGVYAMSGTRLDRDRDAALFSSISRQSVGMACRQCSGCFPATLGTKADFQPNEGSMAVHEIRCAGHVQVAAGTQPNFQAFLGTFGHDVQAMSGMRPGHGHVREASWPQQGWRLIFRHIFAVSGTRCVGHLQDATGTYLEFQDAIGIHSDFHVFLVNFLDTMCRQCLGRIRAAAGMQSDFQTFLGNVQDASGQLQGCSLIFRPYPRRVMATTGMETNFQAFFFSFWDTVFFGHGIQAMSGMPPGRAGMGPDFKAFLESFWARCAGHVRDASWPGQGRSLIFRQFLAVFGHDVPAMSGTPPGQAVFGYGVLAKSGKHPDSDRDAG
ncbi:Hypothetical predicted protein [Olea europaea subsp. europaea]|uniref:Uncharacterized protein n=1 Tax=Olea europaea subsp. europaea TaxID=158383 RepID=A0A8S0PQD9_OLEEU|nr:Hypothetical predicted protein [Olea europaea subsp. europaea]